VEEEDEERDDDDCADVLSEDNALIVADVGATGVAPKIAVVCSNRLVNIKEVCSKRFAELGVEVGMLPGAMPSVVELEEEVAVVAATVASAVCSKRLANIKEVCSKILAEVGVGMVPGA